MTARRIQDELVEALKDGDEARAQRLVTQLAAQPRKARALLEGMLTDSDALVRQAAAFGLGVLGGSASSKRLEQQLEVEEARGDHDGSAVAEEITRALGRVEEASARAGLVRRLERMASGKLAPEDVDTLVGALWKRRHPELIPAVRQCLERLPAPAASVLRALLTLLEKTPEELGAWARDTTVPVEQKTRVLTVLEEELPDTLVPVLPSFIAAASALAETAVRQHGRESSYCDRLLSLLIPHVEQGLPLLTDEAREALHPLARTLVTSVALNCSLRAAVMLRHVGRPEDALLLEANRPAEPVLAKVFDDAARELRHLETPGPNTRAR